MVFTKERWWFLWAILSFREGMTCKKPPIWGLADMSAASARETWRVLVIWVSHSWLSLVGFKQEPTKGKMIQFEEHSSIFFFRWVGFKTSQLPVDRDVIGWSSPLSFAYIGKFSSDFVLLKVKKVFFLAPKYLSLMVFFGVFLHLSLPNSTRVSRWYFHKFIDKVGPESWGGKDSQRMSKYNLKRSEWHF